jgi:hypothetical protein
MKLKDLMGQRFGRLVVVGRGPIAKHTKWICLCDCGNESFADTYGLTNGRAKSCGCYSHDLFAEQAIKHHGRKTKLYGHWCQMKRRCYQPNYEHFDRYGGRGITVCEAWKKDFSTFRLWALLNGYADGLTIDRKDNDGNYEPSNCRWATQTDQVRNRSNTVHVIYQGQKITLGELAELLGMNYKTIHAKYKRGATIAVGVTYYDMYFKDKKVTPCA